MQITKDDDRGGAVLNCAVRYALGRYTYMPGLVMGELRPMLKDCNNKTLYVFERDITEWLDSGGGAHTLEWERFRNDVLKELERRKEEQE